MLETSAKVGSLQAGTCIGMLDFGAFVYFENTPCSTDLPLAHLAHGITHG